MRKELVMIISMLLLVLVSGCNGADTGESVLPHHQIGSSMDKSDWMMDKFDDPLYLHNEFGVYDVHGNMGSFRFVSHVDDEGYIGDVMDEDTASEMGIIFYNYCHQTIDVVSQNRDDFGTILYTIHINDFRMAIYDLDTDIMYDDIDCDYVNADIFVTDHNLKNYVILRQTYDTVQDGKCVHVENEVRHNEDWS